MGFAYTTNLITYTDEANKTLSSVASATGGITCTVTAHGLANDDKVFISGTTDYNGLWVISNIATNTFDIVDQVRQEDNSTDFLAYVSSQSGTVNQVAKDLSGLNGLTGVTTTTSDPSTTAAGHRTYTIDFSTKFENQGHLQIDPNVNTLVIEGEATDVAFGGAWTAAKGNPPLRSSSGGCLYIGVKEKSTDNDIIKYSSGTAINFTYQGENQFSLYLSEFESGTSWYCNGGQIRFSGAHVLRDGAYLVLNALELYASMATGNDSQPQIRVDAVSPSTNYDRIDIYGLTLNGNSDSAIFSKSNFNTLQLTLVNGGYQTYNAGTDAVTLTDLDNINNFAPLDVTETSANPSKFGIVTIQNFSRRVTYAPQSNNRYGYMRCLRQLAVPVTDLDGNGITYSYYGTDIDNGSRGTGSVGSDDTADQVYSGTDQTGNITDNILVETQRFDSGDSVATVDDRTNANDAIPLNVIGYNEQIATYAPSLIGLGDLDTGAVLTPDLLITQSTRATVQAYTGYETVAKGYDGSKDLLCTNYAGESEVLIGRAGSQYDFDTGSATAIVYDSSASSKIDYTGTTLTFDHASAFTGGATGTGAFTIQGGGALDGGTFDNSGGVVYSSTEAFVQNVTVTGTLEFTVAGVYVLSNCTIGEITNVSGGSVVVTATNGTTITTETGPSLTVNYQVGLGVDNVLTGSNVRIENASTGALISEGAESGGEYTDTYNYTGDLSVKIIVRKYGYKTNEFNGTITSTGLVASASQIAESFVVVNEATALAYTGITEDFSAGTVTLSEDHTFQEIFDYLNARAAVLSNLQYDTMISTVNGLTWTGTFDFTINTTYTVSATGTDTETLDIGSNTLTLSGTGTYADEVIITHSAGTNKTIILTGVASGRNYRIEKTSDKSLIYEGTATGTTVSIKHLHTADIASELHTSEYGYLHFDSLFTIDNLKQSILVTNSVDPFVVVNEATASAYTGIALDYAARTGTITEARTVQELYDYQSYQQAQLTNLTYDPVLNTQSGITVNLDMDLTVGTGGTLSSTTQSINTDADNVITQSGGTITCATEVVSGSQLILDDIDSITGSIILSGTADMELEAAGTSPTGSSSATATIEVTTANPSDVFDFSAWTFDASTVFENSSGNNITVNLTPGDTVPTKLETSGTITFSANATVENTNILDDSYVRLYNVTKAAELDLSTVSGGSGYSYTADTATAGVDVGDTLRIEAALYRTDGTIYRMLSESAVLGVAGVSYTGSQQVWDVMQDIHAKGGTYHGANVTGFTLDVANIEVDSSVTEISGWKLATWLYYQVSTTANGMRNYFDAFTSLDSQNFEVDSSKVNLKVDNTGLPATWIEASWTRSDGASIVADTSGTIQFSNGLINVTPVTGSKDLDIDAIRAVTDQFTFTGSDVKATLDGEEVTTDAASRTASQADVSGLATQASVDSDLNIINQGVQKASKLIPHSTDL